MPKFREITGQFVAYVPDGSDPNIVPDRATFTGRVTFTPVFSGGLIAFPNLTPPEFVRPEPITARIIDGFVKVEISPGEDEPIVQQPLSLMVTVDDEASQAWSWRADFYDMIISGDETFTTVPAWSFRVPDGTGPVDLTELVPLKTGGTVDVTKGPRGAGLQTITAVDGQLVFEYTDGQESTIAIPEAVQGPQGEPGPAGADGAEGPQGPQGPAGEIPDLLVGNITDATPTGKNLMLAATEGAARSALGLQTGATSANGALAELQSGTSSTPRVWTANNLATYVDSKVDAAKTVVNVKDYGAAGDGIADDRDAIQAAIDSAKPGQTVLVPSGTYRVGTSITLGDKPITVEASGAKFVKAPDSTDHNTVTIESGYGPMHNVSSVASTTIDTPSGGTVGVSITLAEAPGWSSGDVVRLIADDELPDSIGGTTHVPRSAQFLTVWSVDESTAVLSGVLLDSFTTNVRAAKLNQNVVKWNGGQFDTEDTGGATFRVRSAHRPVIQNIDVLRCQSAAVQFQGCFAPVANDIYVGWGPNNTATYQNGYGVTFGNCQEASVRGVRARQVRHAIDAGGQTQIPAGSTAIYQYGRTFLANVSDVIVDSATSSAFSTHTGAVGVNFSDCIARNPGGTNGNTYGFGLRGLYHTITNCTVQGASRAVVMFDSNPGLSYGITVDGLTCDNVGHIFESNVGERDGSPQYQFREPARNVIRNVHARNMRSSGDLFILNNGTYVIENVSAEMTGTVPGSGLVKVKNCYLTGSEWRIDYSRTTGGSGPFLSLDSGSNSVLELNGLRTTGSSSRMTAFISNSPTQVIRCWDIVMNQMPTTGRFANEVTVSGIQDWSVLANGSGSSGYYSHSSGSVDVGIGKSRRDAIVATWNVDSDVTVGTLPNPARLGQMLTVLNSSASSAVIVRHGSSYRTSLVSGSDVTLQPGRGMVLVSVDASTWQQVSA